MDPGSERLSRRAFVGGSVIVAAAALAGPARLASAGRVVERTTVDDDIPTLDVAEPITGAAWSDDRLVAVGGVPSSPRVWTYGLGDGWRPTAGSASFPAGSALTDVAGFGTGFVAVGWIEEPAGPRPAAFGSDDASVWTEVDLADLRPGLFTGVAAAGVDALLVGARFAEPTVREPVEPIAVRSTGAGWTAASLRGVEAPVHGAVTTVAPGGDGFLLATVGVGGSKVFTAASADGPWRAVSTPTVTEPLAILAAVPLDGTVLLASLDALDRPRYWRGGVKGWREVPAPAPLGTSSHVVGLALDSGTLVAAGTRDETSFVEEVTSP
jgi:hypothetical protein